MQRARQNLAVYGLLLAAWAGLMGWQAAEHARAVRAARAQLIRRADDISGTLGIVLRSQRRFGSVISKERLEAALGDLLHTGELEGIALLNATGRVVAAAGATPDPDAAQRWDGPTITVENLVALGASVARDLESATPAVVLSREEFAARMPTNHPPPRGAVTPPPEAGKPPPDFSTAPPSGPQFHFFGGGRLMRTLGMSEADYKEFATRQGVHGFRIAMSTAPVRTEGRRDAWLRGIIALLATLAALSVALAWHNLGRSQELQIRLARAGELNAYLRELNIAAAGLAHETRNPLNIVRGFAQMIARREDAPDEVREKARAIIAESDKVTAQLNEFINYARPRELRPTALALREVAREVTRALSFDAEEKRVSVAIQVEPDAVIEADGQLLRQLLFNLLLNAIQAVDAGGAIVIAAGKGDAGELWCEVRDDGPGVPEERRQEIFKPYFTAQKSGTGLGLAVVRQIARTHGWEVACLANSPRGAIFRVEHLKRAAPPPV